MKKCPSSLNCYTTYKKNKHNFYQSFIAPKSSSNTQLLLALSLLESHQSFINLISLISLLSTL